MAPEPESSSTPNSSLRDRYIALIDQIVTITLKGQLRSKEQIYQQLVQEVEVGTGEIFERCLTERLEATQAQVEQADDELKQARASRSLRAMQTIQGEWERYQKQQQASNALTRATEAILQAASTERLSVWLTYVDPNQGNRFNPEALKQLAQALDRAVQSGEWATDDNLSSEIQLLTTGIRDGLVSCQRLEDALIRWIYEPVTSIGFEGSATVGPWKLWAEQVQSPVPKQLFQTLAGNQSVANWVHQSSLGIREWIELAVLLQFLQRSLVAWFEKQPYSSKWGKTQSIATYLTFAAIWCELLQGIGGAVNLNTNSRQALAQGCFQALLQVLRGFSQQPYFPLYGGIFALFSGSYLTDALQYLDQPLRQVAGTQEKARILTLLGYSQRALGQYQQAIGFHQQALEIARTAADQACEIANLNHLSRIYVAQKNYVEAINYSQRALILARQVGDRLGEANALTNFGYSEVLSARELDRIDSDRYDMAVGYLQQGLQLSEKLGDRQSQSLCYNSLGIAYVILNQPQQAIAYLEKGVQAAQASGDLYLQGLNLTYLAEAYYSLDEREKTVLAALLSMYLLNQISATEWRQSAGLLTILQGQLGEVGFEQLRRQLRPQLIPVIGVDGYDHLPTLLNDYRQSDE
ncbi:tetratricopeptide repeat protein [Leptolyngbya sp. NK1-12]|uniref:Tetratricopeptide repeat protein n=1 Tax=Leptolyngbya sp. NK1-12 TaxID=2547451 RepID=A0AA97AJR5_9CYAN|nr:tetratricopeptide repeat protein [Leptolyngbya sp. NK1-12]WNZ25201.1 tetratricopeptide repeat protein [Leptolyngbya sp. NK1-12]